MKDKIEVGEYIRTKTGNIFKVIEITKTSYGCCGITDNEHISTFTIGKGGNAEIKIKKHSKNIIDLIEVGDYVNGSKVIDIAQGKIKAVFIESQEQKLALIPIVEKQIKSIVTHEQMEEMEYRV